jgi:hypothetical protein
VQNVEMGGLWLQYRCNNHWWIAICFFFLFFAVHIRCVETPKTVRYYAEYKRSGHRW